MTDRMDIDALLISALYGELTPADEARLTAHLESHPADRTALADLTQTRAAVRESRILSVQFEPPQAVSALLLQEAARRAPKPAREVAGWFHRFTRSFMMHPAMAAAAMLVLVVGVAGTLYVRRGDPFVESAAPAPADRSRAQDPSPSPSTPALATPPESLETGRPADGKNSAGDGLLAHAGSAAGSDAFRVGLDEAAGSPKAGKAAPPPDEQGRAQGDTGRLADTEAYATGKDKDQSKEMKGGPRGGEQERGFAQPAKPEVAVAKPAKHAKQDTIAGIELRSRELLPKDLDDEKPSENDQGDRLDKTAKKVSAQRYTGAVGNAEIATTTKAPPAPGMATAGGGAATAEPGMMPQANHAAAAPPAVPAADPAAGTPPSPAPSSIAKFKAPGKTVSRPSPAPGVAQAPPPAPASPPAAEPPSLQRDSRRLADKQLDLKVDAKAEEKTADDKALLDWAQKQHDQVLALVKANNCRAAADAAVAIYNRAPDFYAANIATDRSIKPCIAYVNDVRERAERSRAAAKRANAADTPAQAAPPPARK